MRVKFRDFVKYVVQNSQTSFMIKFDAFPCHSNFYRQLITPCFPFSHIINEPSQITLGLFFHPTAKHSEPIFYLPHCDGPQLFLRPPSTGIDQ